MKETMPKISPGALREVQDALEQYARIVEATRLAPQSKETYLGHAEQFVRWLADDFEPGSRRG